MRDSSVLGDFPCEFLLNGVSIKSAKIRQSAGSEGDFDVVVTDPLVGAFALHSGFDIDVHEANAGWRRVTVEELKGFSIGDAFRRSPQGKYLLLSRNAGCLPGSMTLRSRNGSVADFLL